MLKGGLKSVLLALALGGSLSMVACGSAMAGKRMALLIGNANYKNVPSLRNPINDARGVKEALEKIGFQADLVSDVNEKKFRKALKDFADRARDAEAVLFYYAGHGVEEQKVGYLLPTDVERDDLRSIELSQVPSIDLVATAMSSVRGPKILIVDACREDPNSRDVTVGEVQVRNVAVRGLGDARTANEPVREDGMLIVFSTASRAVAYDGGGSQGPFASSLIRHLAEPGLSANELFHKVNADVQTETSNQQRTSFFDSLRTAYKLNLGVTDDEAAWEKIKGANDPKLYDDFIRQFPDSARASLAAWKRDTILELIRQRDEERAAASEQRAWNEAMRSDTADAYASFVAAYPKSAHVAEAGQRRERLGAAAVEEAAWKDAIGKRTLEAYEKFAAAYPRSVHRDEALKLRDEMRAQAAENAAWAAASRDKTADSYDKFASAYPNSPHRNEALKLSGEIRAATAEASAWAAAGKEKSAEAYEKFAQSYPTSAHAAEAQRLAQDARETSAEAAAWTAALNDNSAVEFEQFLSVFPNSPHQREATKRRDDLRAAALAAQEKAAWASAGETNTVDGYFAFIDQFPRSARVAEARRRINDQKAAEGARASAEAKAQLCIREGEALAAKIAAHAGPSDYEALLRASNCATQRPAIELALEEAKKAKAAAACETDRAALARAGSDLAAVQAGMMVMTCESARQEAKTVIALLQEQAARANAEAQAREAKAKADARAKELAQRSCDAAGLALEAVDIYEPAARDRVVAVRDKSGCGDSAFVARVDEKLTQVSAQVRTAQEELGRVGCYSADINGVFDAATQSALTVYWKQSGQPVSLRVSPTFLEQIRQKEDGRGCGGEASTVAKTTPSNVTALAHSTEVQSPPPISAPLQKVNPAPRSAPPPRPVAHVPQVVKPERAAPRPAAAPREAARPAPERRLAAQPTSRRIAESPAPRAAPAAAPQIMFVPN